MSADQIVDAIIADIEDRAGLGAEWAQIDPDIRREIRDEWIAIVLTPLGHAFPKLEARARAQMADEPDIAEPEPDTIGAASGTAKCIHCGQRIRRSDSEDYDWEHESGMARCDGLARCGEKG